MGKLSTDGSSLHLTRPSSSYMMRPSFSHVDDYDKLSRSASPTANDLVDDGGAEGMAVDPGGADDPPGLEKVQYKKKVRSIRCVLTGYRP